MRSWASMSCTVSRVGGRGREGGSPVGCWAGLGGNGSPRGAAEAPRQPCGSGQTRERRRGRLPLFSLLSSGPALWITRGWRIAAAALQFCVQTVLKCVEVRVALLEHLWIRGPPERLAAAHMQHPGSLRRCPQTAPLQRMSQHAPLACAGVVCAGAPAPGLRRRGLEWGDGCASLRGRTPRQDAGRRQTCSWGAVGVRRPALA